MPPLTVVARIVAHPDRVDLVKAALLELIPTTRGEAGCLRYDLHQDDEDPARFLFYETWESRELWQAHMQAPHLTAYVAATEGAIAEFEVRELHQIG